MARRKREVSQKSLSGISANLLPCVTHSHSLATESVLKISHFSHILIPSPPYSAFPVPWLSTLAMCVHQSRLSRLSINHSFIVALVSPSSQVKTFHPCSPPIPFTRNRTTEEANRPHNGPPVSFCVFFFFFISCPLSRFGDAHSRFDGRIPPIHKQTHTSLVPVRKKGITSILLTSFANISQQNHNTASTTNNNNNNHATAGAGGSAGKDGVSFFPDSATGLSSNKTRKNDFYIGN